MRSWDGRERRRLTKWLSTGASGEESLKPYVPDRIDNDDLMQSWFRRTQKSM